MKPESISNVSSKYADNVWLRSIVQAIPLHESRLARSQRARLKGEL
jgi:hypothetical protein